MDKNSDGAIELHELKSVYEEFFGKKLNDDEAKRIFDSMDLDGNGVISYSEFSIAALN